MAQFVNWLYQQLNKRNWSISQLARMSQGETSHSNISKVLSGKLAPTADFCLAVARALGESEIDVLYMAGHIHNREKPITFDDPFMRELYQSAENLTPDQRKTILALIEQMSAGNVTLKIENDQVQKV